MNIAFLFALLIAAPSPAKAYLVPLIGAGGVLLTMLTGVLAVFCAAVFLVFYNIRRALRRARGKDAPDTGDDAEH